MGVFPVRRGEADRGAVRAALAVLDSGGCIALFPEGTRGRGWPKALKRARPGVAFLARVSGAPVVPVGIAGTEVIDTPGEIAPNLLRRPVFRVRIGDPISLGDVGATRRDTERATDMVMRAIAQLLPCRYWGAYQPAMEHR